MWGGSGVGGGHCSQECRRRTRRRTLLQGMSEVDWGGEEQPPLLPSHSSGGARTTGDLTIGVKERIQQIYFETNDHLLHKVCYTPLVCKPAYGRHMLDPSKALWVHPEIFVTDSVYYIY